MKHIHLLIYSVLDWMWGLGHSFYDRFGKPGNSFMMWVFHKHIKYGALCDREGMI